MGAKFFSQRTTGRSVDAGDHAQASGIGLEHQQALVLGALRRAAGAPVSYAELREAGVELPASVVSELELAGVAIERCSANGGVVGVRLDPVNDPAPPAWRGPAPTARAEAIPTPERAGGRLSTGAADERAWGGVRKYRASSLEGLSLAVLGWLSWPIRRHDRQQRQSAARRNRIIAPRAAVVTETKEAAAVPAGTNDAPVRADRVMDNRKRRTLAVTALLAGVVVVSVLGALWAAGGGRGTRAPIAKRPPSRVLAPASAPPARAAQSTHPSPPPPRVPVSPALATDLEAQGHSLLEAGRYDAAVPVLKRAVLATGETLGGCIEPASSTCLTYAYALYDLGRAVRLSGAPQAAVPILERRLEIDDQRGVVSDELQLARQGIG